MIYTRITDRALIRQVIRRSDKVRKKIFSIFRCHRCGNCCKFVPPQLLNDDVKQMSKSLAISKKEFCSRYTIMIHNELHLKRPCPFLEEGNHCRIYTNRPQVCREYPLKPEYYVEKGKIVSLTAPLFWTVEAADQCKLAHSILSSIAGTLKIEAPPQLHDWNEKCVKVTLVLDDVEPWINYLLRKTKKQWNVSTCMHATKL